MIPRTKVLLKGIAPMVLCVMAAARQSDSKAQMAQTACIFDDGKQISVQYYRAPESEKNLPSKRVWAPGGEPMLLFSNTPLELGESQIPVGAYSMYVLPDKREWTLIVNRDVTAGTAYQESQDLARVPMQIGQLDEPQKQTSISFRAQRTEAMQHAHILWHRRNVGGI